MRTFTADAAKESKEPTEEMVQQLAEAFQNIIQPEETVQAFAKAQADEAENRLEQENNKETTINIAELSEEELSEILIISNAPAKTKEISGNLTITISSFSPIRSVFLQGEQKEIDNNSYSESYSIPYKLDIGENKFVIEVTTETAVKKKKFVIFRETDILEKKKEKTIFQLLTIFGYASDNNVNKSPEGEKQITSGKYNLILLPSYTHYWDYRNAFAMQGLYATDRWHQVDLRAKQIIFRQLMFEWIRSYTPLGQITTGIGINELGLYDNEKKSAKRDRWDAEYRQIFADRFLNVAFKSVQPDQTTYQLKFERKFKNMIDAEGEDGVADQLEGSSKFNIGTYRFNGRLRYTLTNVIDDQKDQSQWQGTFGVSFPIKLIFLKIQHEITATEKRVLSKKTGIKTKERMNVTTLTAIYSVAPWLMLNLAQKYVEKTSNLVKKDYSKQQTIGRLIFIYRL